MQRFKKNEMDKKIKVLKFIPFTATSRNMAVPHIAKDKHKIWLDNSRMKISQIWSDLQECKKNELAMSAKLH